MRPFGNSQYVASHLIWWILPFGIGLVVIVTLLTRLLATDVGDALTRNTVRLSLAWYAVALFLMMQLAINDWAATSAFGQLARWCWTLALVCFLVHLVMAFHYYHHWSHSHAYERTRRIAGIGEGLYFSYLFTWLWMADVIAWWQWPKWYATRSALIDRGLHGFMLFVVFNSMVVFESGMIRWAGLGMFAVLGSAWLITRKLPGASVN
jgi:hypothetical protein